VRLAALREERERDDLGGARRGGAARRGAARWSAELSVLSEALTGEIWGRYGGDISEI